MPDGLPTPEERARLGDAACERFEERLGALCRGMHLLDDKPEETPVSAMRALWFLAADRPLSAPAALGPPLCPLTPAQEAALDALLARRLSGEPLAYLTGRQRFMGVELLAGPQALIPRTETELLGGAAAALLAGIVQERGGATAVDVCTGSGNLAIGLARAAPAARILASDLSEEAVLLARRNVAHVGLEGRVEVRQGDLLEPFDGPDWSGAVDLVVCNPPYISSGKLPSMPAEIAGFEPSLAFDGGPFGISILNRLIQEAPRLLRPAGWLAFEVGLGQAAWVQRRMAATGRFDELRPLADERGDAKAIVGRFVG